MNILIGYKQGDVVYMGTDTRIIVGDVKRNETSECNYNIQKMEDGLLVGICAERIEKQTLIAYAPDIFTLDKNGALTKKHIVKEIVPKLIQLMDEADLLVRKEGQVPFARFSILLAHKDVLYEVSSNFTVIRYETFQALGHVADFAQATLIETKDTDDIESRIVRALDIASKNSHEVGAPYVLINTKDLEYQIIRRDGIC